MTPATIFDDIRLGLVFFTRLPLPHFEVRDRSLADAIWTAPLVGFVVAVLAWLAFAAGQALGLAEGPTAALAIAAAMLVTGCLHEDGLSDTSDGFGGGRTRERKLEIMRDSCIGSYGAAALALSILARWSAIVEIEDPAPVFAALVAAHVGSRALIPAFMQNLPQARADGLAAGVGTVADGAVIAALAIGAAGLLFLGLSGAVVAALCLALLFFAFRKLCLAQIGGQSGDTIGALQQMAEIALLFVASAILA
ncbi:MULTISPECIES: adenosylcobinamide-GDP ribazoletransferase [Aminobacter]|uniref:Adenosylcobinamide-GDP ribazoletransferase n=1 Tax=Aminobacter ciceronei TaxID=150723 RepID=A0ABR6C183_9HYPH|nr:MULTISPECIES: adenosylcobinamide-GDP ribazoletransferase [Aminobacter]MBA8904716.1 adenosylcobinamide-GDP ribazoletransferase [Aminobacter ciceronei]MBA9018730.1 adenosylcobinamide-GDP ribazoletransferase [Aminobacter ciceronei]WMC95094.1 adenosylcobinamide-GDP ribazoletransferase [Aminobacter aminovorans]BBD38640.1 cobalamin synthase [Aminobacter sp. SS-2016]